MAWDWLLSFYPSYFDNEILSTTPIINLKAPILNIFWHHQVLEKHVFRKLHAKYYGAPNGLDQTGLEWKEQLFGLEPCWTIEPNIADITKLARENLKIGPDEPCHVEFYAQGALNKLYKVQTESKTCLMRVTLPVDPYNKTNSEVATIKFLHQNTNIPALRIFAFDDSRESGIPGKIGFEWILMEILPGKSLEVKWHKMSEDSKQKVVKQVASSQAQLFCHKLHGIGNLFDNAEPQANSPYPSPGFQETNLKPVLGQIVSPHFFMVDHVLLDVPRGPFTSKFTFSFVFPISKLKTPTMSETLCR